MKRLLVILVCCLAMAALMVTPVMAESDNAQGAVQGDLFDYNGVYGEFANPVVVGWFNVNATASGELRVVVNLNSADEAADMTDLPIRVIIRAQSPAIPDQINVNFPAAISTNGQGQGNATVKVDISDICAFDPAPETIMVTVFVNPGGSPNLFEGPHHIYVPLK